jgi:hypothetical protein
VGWEYLHLAVDDHSRLAYSQILPDEKRASCLRFLFKALRFFRSHGVTVSRVMTDNGSSFRSFRYAKALRLLKIRHLRTKPYTPKTNGKAERFVQTSLREWAYARAYNTSEERAAELPVWLHRYNWHRPHGSLCSKPPISRIDLTMDNLLRLHTRAVPEQQLHPVGPLGSKYIDHAAERVRAQRLVNHRREPVHPLAEIDRLHRDQDLHARGGNDHAAPFSARTILASVAPSAVNGTRATIAPTRISKTAPSSAACSAGASNITGAKPGASDLSIARPLADRRHPNSCCEVIA